jgi:hypothetical protein
MNHQKMSGMKPPHLSRGTMEDSFRKAFGDFIRVFTIKRVAVMFFVGLIIFLICVPQSNVSNEPTSCDENSCPFWLLPQ